jgi:hypothetical protein
MRGWVHGGSGAEAARRVADSWRAEEKYMRDLSQRVQDRMKAAGVSIQGQSGEAMQNAVSPVVLWTDVSADNAQAQAQRLDSQGEAFAKLQTSIPAQNEEQHPPEANFLQQGWAALSGGKTDNELATAHNEKLRQDAINAFRTYDNTSQNNVQSSAVFTPPPQAGQPAPPAGSPAAGGGSASGSHAAAGLGHSAGHGNVAGGAGAHNGGGVAHGTAAASSGAAPAGTNPSGAAPAGNQPWQQGNLAAPGSESSPGAIGGLLGAGGAAAGGYGASRGATGSEEGGTRSGAGASARGGLGGSTGGRGGAGEGGASGRGGAGAAEEAATGASAKRNNANGAGAGAPAAGAPGAGHDDEDEHYSPEFLRGDHGFFDDDLPQVAPPVLGQEREPDH